MKDILEEGFEGARMAECGNAQEMLDHVREAKYDLVVMDISMPGQRARGAEGVEAVGLCCRS
ncbi:MAG: response regulator [Nitrospiraceae bacterium]